MFNALAINLQTSSSLIIIWAIVVFALAKVYFFTRRDPRMEKYLKAFDGPFSLPIVGSAFWLLRPVHEVVPLARKWQKQFGGCFRVWIGKKPYLFVSEASEVERILSSNIHLNKGSDYSFMHKWFGLGLITARAEQWRHRRKLLTSTFHFKILEQFSFIFNEQGNILLDVLEANADKGNFFDLWPFIARCALDILCETAMGKQIHAQTGQSPDYVNAIVENEALIAKRIVWPWLRYEFIWKILGYAKSERHYLKILDGFIEKVILERQNEKRIRNTSNHAEQAALCDEELHFTKRRVAFLDLLLDIKETDGSLQNSDVRDETATFMSAGHDTTANSITWVLFNLSLYPEHQRKVQMELDEIFGDDPKRLITTVDFSKMKYLECCIKEALRLYPTAPGIIRELGQDVEFGNNKIAPRGINVLIAHICLHMDPKVFPDPYTFNPDRFSVDNSAGRHPYAYIPFSAGPRNCIGQKFAMLEEKILLAKLFLKYDFQTEVKNPAEIKLTPDIVLRPTVGIPFKLSRRQRQRYAI